MNQYDATLRQPQFSRAFFVVLDKNPRADLHEWLKTALQHRGYTTYQDVYWGILHDLQLLNAYRED
jgi:hypothetical protein